jgi:hypothetical protein
MTNQALVPTSVSERFSEMSSIQLAGPAPQPPASATSSYQTRLIEAMKSQYHLDQQVKFLHLQAEADSLLRQLQAIKRQREAAIEANLQSD